MSFVGSGFGEDSITGAFGMVGATGATGVVGGSAGGCGVGEGVV